MNRFETISAGYSTEFTLKDELYLKRGEIMCNHRTSTGCYKPFQSKHILDGESASDKG